MKLRIKSSLNPAIFRGEKFDRIVAGSIWEVNGEKWDRQYIAVTPGITFEQIEWVRDLPPVKKDLKEWKVPSTKGKRTCDCNGFHYRRQCRHINEVK
jgi:hypothetical protein